VTSNVAPALCVEVQELCAKGDYAAALAVHEKLVPLHKAMFLETNPIPVKYAMARMRRATLDIRLPLTVATPATRAAIDAAMLGLGLIRE